MEDIHENNLLLYYGVNVGLGKDYTIFALIDGVVKYEPYSNDRRKVSVYAEL